MTVWSLGWEVPLKDDMATHSSILAWRIPWTEDPGGLQSIGPKESDTTEVTQHSHARIHARTHTHTHTHWLSIILYLLLAHQNCKKLLLFILFILSCRVGIQILLTTESNLKKKPTEVRKCTLFSSKHHSKLSKLILELVIFKQLFQLQSISLK